MQFVSPFFSKYNPMTVKNKMVFYFPNSDVWCSGANWEWKTSRTRSALMYFNQHCINFNTNTIHWGIYFGLSNPLSYCLISLLITRFWWWSNLNPDEKKKSFTFILFIGSFVLSLLLFKENTFFDIFMLKSTSKHLV